MARPRFLMVEPAPGYALSSRKLVLESAEYEVATARSWAEATKKFERLRHVEAVIVSSAIGDGLPCEEFVRAISQKTPKPLVIVLSAREGGQCVPGDYQVSAHEPEALLDLLRSLFEVPSTAAA